MNRKHWFLISFFILAGICIAGCAPKKIIATEKFGAYDSQNSVLIATQDSDFKNTIVANVVDELGQQDILIEVTDINNLRQVQTQQYKAIVILGEYKFFQLNRHVEHFLKNHPKEVNAKIFLVNTAGSPHRVKNLPEVDAISSASEGAETKDVSDKVLQKIDTLLSGE